MNFNVLYSNYGGTATIDAQGNGPIFTIENGVTVTLQNLILENGKANNVVNTAFGGAIENECENGLLTVKNCTFEDNTANSSGCGYGGAIDSSEGSLNVYDSTFISNTATTNGGAIYATGWLYTVTELHFRR